MSTKTKRQSTKKADLHLTISPEIKELLFKLAKKEQRTASNYLQVLISKEAEKEGLAIDNPNEKTEPTASHPA